MRRAEEDGMKMRWIALMAAAVMLTMPVMAKSKDKALPSYILTARTVAVVIDPSAGIDPDIVGITAQREAARGREILAAEKPHRAIAGAGDDHDIRFLRIGDTLWLAEPGDLLDPVPAREIHDIEAVIAERGHQQPLAAGVHGHVIDPPGNPGQRDLAF